MWQFERKIISFEVTVTETFRQNKHNKLIISNSKVQMCGFYYLSWIYDICLHCSKSDIIAENNGSCRDHKEQGVPKDSLLDP